MTPLQDIVDRIAQSSAPGPTSTRVIAVDGLGGAGKSTLAERLGEALGSVAIVHTDDFANWTDSLDWWPRLIEEVLDPLSNGLTARFQRYDWDQRTVVEWLEVQPASYVIIEGVSASRDAFQPYLAFSIWVETPREERLKRGLERDGQAAHSQWLAWMAGEDAYVVREHPACRADLVVRGTESIQ
ncbi:MAG: AAA family ATPase [Acidimicrobiales bacterium]